MTAVRQPGGMKWIWSFPPVWLDSCKYAARERAVVRRCEMTEFRADKTAQVSPSMIQSVFLELKANGYTDRQIQALGAGLGELADKKGNSVSRKLLELNEQRDGSEEGLFLIGYPEGFAALCMPSLSGQL
jgi:hypothetical protein